MVTFASMPPILTAREACSQPRMRPHRRPITAAAIGALDAIAAMVYSPGRSRQV